VQDAGPGEEGWKMRSAFMKAAEDTFGKKSRVGDRGQAFR
jgi:hypothetical protein